MLTVWQGRRFSAVKLSVSPSREQLERIMAIIRAMPSLWQMVRWSASASPGPGHTRCRRPRSRSQCYNPLCSSLATYTTMINGLRTSLPTGITSYNRLWHNGQNGDKCGSLNATNQLQLLNPIPWDWERKCQSLRCFSAKLKHKLFWLVHPMVVHWIPCRPNLKKLPGD